MLAFGFAPAVPGNAVAARRRRRRVQTALDHAFGTDVLALLDADSGRAVVPADREPPENLAQLVGKAYGTGARIAAVTAAGPEGVPEAARTATEILRVTRACGIPPGLHRLDDVLLEFHLSRPSESSHQIAALLDPVADRPELIGTLRTFLAQQQDRRATATLLGLHPNTVDNRLAKTAERTGIDLSSPRGTALAIAALLLRDAASPQSADDASVRP
ncbi:PucR family transcriptional regulator [Streptomyces sp. NPDC055287]